MKIEKTLCPGCSTPLSVYTYAVGRRAVGRVCDSLGIGHRPYGDSMYGDDRDVLYYCESCGREYNEYLLQVPGENNQLNLCLVGAILGDIVGSPYEHDEDNILTKEFPLISDASRPTDDSVMTIAIADGLMNSAGGTDDEIRAALTASVRYWGSKYPDAGYGGMFSEWLITSDPAPYNSYGNGSAMRVSAAGWLADSMYEARRLGRLTAEITHNHIEGIRGAEAVAAAIYLARNASDKDFIREYIEMEFDYDLTRTCGEIRSEHHHPRDCMHTVPEAITAFLEGQSFIDCVRTAVSLGGDSDTVAAITGSIAEAYYGVTHDLQPIIDALPDDMRDVIDRFNAVV